MPDGKLVLYKAVMWNFGSWWRASRAGAAYRPSWWRASRDAGAYRPGTTVICRRCCHDILENCGEGLHVGTLFGAQNFGANHECAHIVKVLVDPADVVCVPDRALLSHFPPPIFAQDQKIRCRRLLVDSVVETWWNRMESPKLAPSRR